jgi:hypothetical protein
MSRFVCDVCSDTHVMDTVAGYSVPCTACPLPCDECRAGDIGAYCTEVACRCACHNARTTALIAAYLTERREPGDGYCDCGRRLDEEHTHGND